MNTTLFPVNATSIPMSVLTPQQVEEPVAPSVAQTPPLRSSETSNSKSNDTTEAWSVILETMSKHDEQMIQDWKDDLGNLLIFAGLFSSVVSGFALESYGFLQQDTSTPDASVQLLAQISSQLASFSISQGFVNSTVVPTPLAILDAPSGPSELDVRVNALWFLSLAMSLIASLVAIMVQQWLREYRLPSYISIQDRIKLRQYRYEAFETWNVPLIVSILPILLQVALVLFLVGLCYLLHNLDKTVAKTFIAFVGIALSAYFAFTVLPITFRRCPYKNSFAYGAITIVEEVSKAILAIVCAAGIMLVILVDNIFLAWQSFSGASRPHYLGTLWKKGVRLIAATQIGLRLSEHDYWAAREIGALPKVEHLAQNTLISAQNLLSSAELTYLDQCLQDLSPVERMCCVCVWACQTLNVNLAQLIFAKSMNISAFNATDLAKIDKAFADRYRHSFLEVMPVTVIGHLTLLGDGGLYESSVLTVLRHIARLQSDDIWINTYARRVLDIRGAQTPNDFHNTASHWMQIPTACLFELSTVIQFDFSAEDVSALLDYAIQNHDTYSSHRYSADTLIQRLDVMLASWATVLDALYRQPAVLTTLSIREKCQHMLKNLDFATTKYADQISAQATNDSGGWPERAELVFVPACNSLCNSVAYLAGLAALPFDGDLSLSTLTEHLIHAFQGQAFEPGRNILLALRNAHSEADPPPASADPTVESTRDTQNMHDASRIAETTAVVADDSTVVVPNIECEATTGTDNITEMPRDRPAAQVAWPAIAPS